MANKRPKPEEIVSKLRQVEVLMGQGMARLDAIRQIGVVEQTYTISFKYLPNTLSTKTCPCTNHVQNQSIILVQI